MTKVDRRRRTALISCATALIAVLAAGVADGQELNRVVLRATVVDQVTRMPIAGAVVTHVGTSTVAVTDSLGSFSLDVPRRSSYPLRIEQLGYRALRTFLDDGTGEESALLELVPNPFELEGLLVRVATPLAARRRAGAVDARVLDAAAIFRLGVVGDQILRAAVPRTRLCSLPSGELCIYGRGGPQKVSICLDEQPAWGGAGDLSRYEPWELHSIEVYGRGAAIRVYTRDFVERILREGRRLTPLVLGC